MRNQIVLRVIVAAAGVAHLALCQSIPANSEFVVKLLSPLSTETSRKGDKVTAQVVSPRQYEGAYMEGSVKESKSGGKVKGKSVLNFSFETLNVNGRQIQVASSVKSVVNSKGKQNVDEEGRVIEKKNNLGKAAVATGVGALIGGIAGGAKGAAIGAGVGAAASLIFIEVAVQVANVAFAPGSQFVLDVKERR